MTTASSAFFAVRHVGVCLHLRGNLLRQAVRAVDFGVTTCVGDPTMLMART